MRLTTLLCLAALLAPPSDAFADGWTFSTVDATRYSGNSLSFRVTGTGLRRYAWWTAGQGIVVTGDGWASEILPGPYGPQAVPGGAAPASPQGAELLITNSVGLALDPDGSPWVAHVRHDCSGDCTGTARVSHRGPAGWTTEDLGVSYSRPAIEAGTDGRVHVAYASGGHQLHYWVRATGGTWTDEPLSACDDTPALRLDAADVPHLSWTASGRLWYAVRADGAWQAQVVDSGGLTTSNLAVTPAGEARILYYASGSGPAKGLWYAEQGAGGWTRTLAVPGVAAGWQSGLALDPARDPFVVYNDQSGLDLRFASRKQGVWTKGDVDTLGNTGYWPIAAFDPGGRPLVAYQADASLGVRLATGAAIAGVAPAPALRLAIRALGPGRAGAPLRFELRSPVATRLSFELLDVAGRVLARDGPRDVPAGASAQQWDAGVSRPGVYLLRARSTAGDEGVAKVPLLR